MASEIPLDIFQGVEYSNGSAAILAGIGILVHSHG